MENLNEVKKAIDEGKTVVANATIIDGTIHATEGYVYNSTYLSKEKTAEDWVEQYIEAKKNLDALGIVVEATPHGYRWNKKRGDESPN